MCTQLTASLPPRRRLWPALCQAPKTRLLVQWPPRLLQVSLSLRAECRCTFSQLHLTLHCLFSLGAMLTLNMHVMQPHRHLQS